MAYSYTAFTGNGSTTQYAVSFPYIRREHVAVTVAGVPSTFTWVNSSLIQMDAAPAAAAAVRVYRTTPISAPLVDFADGATLVAADLDTNSRQSIYIQQELDDAQTDNLPNLIPNGNKGDITTSVGGTVWAINTGAVAEAKIAAGAVTEAKLGTGAVTETKIGTGAVTSAKILDGTILNADVNASAGITAGKLSFTQAGTGATARTIDSKLKDVVSVKDFGAVGDGTTDDTAAIQAAINYALSLAQGGAYTPWVTVAVQFPPAIYKVAGNLVVPTPPVVLSLEAIGRATLLHTGTGACLKIGDGSTYGIMPMRIKGLSFSRTASIAGSIGLLIDICSNGVYDDLGFDSFEIGVKALGAINCIFDFKRHGITGAQTGILLESKVGTAGGLRFDANLTLIQNIMFQGSCVNGIIIKTGTGVSPIGTGGCIRIDKCTFEGVTQKSIQVENYGEASGSGDELLVTDSWFEGYGTTIAEITNSKMKFSNCFIAGGSANMWRLMDNYSGVVIDACTGYFLDSAATNGLVTLGGTATTSALKNVVLDRGGYSGLTKLHNTYPITSQGVQTVPIKTFVIQYNSNYPTGNNDYNWGLALVMRTEINKFIGPDWVMARILFSGDDGATASVLVIDAIRNKPGGVTLVAVTTPPAYTITNNGTSTATITFNNDGSGRWYQLQAVYQITAY
jgi:hypothetical protein